MSDSSLISSISLESENYHPWSSVRRCLRDNTLSCFDVVLARGDEHNIILYQSIGINHTTALNGRYAKAVRTDGQTDRHRAAAYTTLA